VNRRRILVAALVGLLSANIVHAREPGGHAGADRPLIGVASVASDDLVRSLRDCGAVPVVLPAVDAGNGAIDSYLKRLDALLLPGGADIPPAEYGARPHPTVKPLDDDRYAFEKALGKAWIERTDKPLLGICLGGQWINVLCGGSLVQDIPSQLGSNHRGVTHPVTIKPESRLAAILGARKLEVNSSHHQAVLRLGKGLRAVAHSPDGVIEAIETTHPKRFLLGVQWHPERLVATDPLQRKLIRALVEAAAVPSHP
jgi:putative glutamine amidotransferase